MTQFIENLITTAPVLGVLIGGFFALLVVAGVIAGPLCNWMESKGWLK